MRSSTIEIPFNAAKPETAVLADVPTAACVVHVSGDGEKATLHIQEGDKADREKTPTAFFVMAHSHDAPGFVVTNKHPGRDFTPETAILKDGEPDPDPVYVRRVGKFTAGETLFFVYERLSV